jgi:hypothetical protein
MTHTWSDHIGGQFDELCTVPGAEAWILVDDRCEDPAAIRTLYQRCHSFRFDALARLPYPMLATGSLRGNAHIPVLDFYSHHNHFDYYWFMEHDVRYTGQWRALFDLFHPFDHDFITTHLRWYRQEPGWAWWDTFKPAGVPIDRVGWVRSFNVIYRKRQTCPPGAWLTRIY